MSSFKMVSKQPYMLRALYDWIIDSRCTPHLLVNANYPGVSVPADYVEDGRIVLNMSPQAVNSLSLSNESVSFHARFSGKPMFVEVPMAAVNAIYARETGEGITFDHAMTAPDGVDTVVADDELQSASIETKPPILKVVK